MKIPKSRLFGLCLGLLSAPWAFALSLTELVDDQTVIAIAVSDTPALLRGWDASPFARTWNDPQVVKFLAPLRTQMKIDEWDDQVRAKTGRTLRELLDMAEGEMLFTLPVASLPKPGAEKTKSTPGFFLGLQVGPKASELEKFLIEASGNKHQTETYAEVTVHLETKSAQAEDKAIAWVILDGNLLLSTDKAIVFAAIDAAKAGGHAKALGRNEQFLSARARSTKTAQVFVYSHLSSVFPYMREAVVAAKEGKKDKDGKASSSMFDSVQLLDTLALDVWQDVYLACDLGDKTMRLDAGVSFSEKRGLAKLLSYESGPPLQPNWVPAKWTSVSTARFSLRTFYETLEELLESFNPMISGMAQGQLRTMNRKLGIDLKRDLIDSVGNEFVSANILPTASTPDDSPTLQDMEKFVSISLLNPEAFTRAIESIKQMIGPAATQLLEKRTYLDADIYTLKNPSAGPDDQGFSYAIARSQLMLGIGSANTIEAALQGMAAGGKDAYWQRPEIKAQLADLPDAVTSFSVQDLPTLLVAGLASWVQVQEALDEDKRQVDLSARPDLELLQRYWGMSHSYSTEEANHFHTIMRMDYPTP